MKEIYFATTNKSKIEALQKACADVGVTIKQLAIELPEPRSDDLQEIAMAKVKYAYKQIKKPVLALDAGFFIHSLNGFPRAFVNFALDSIGVKGILKLVDGLDRRCEFRNCLTYYDGNNEPVFFESETKGELLKVPREKIRHFWSDLHTVFLPEGSEKTLCEMTEKEHLAYKKQKELDNFAEKFAEWICQ